MIDSSFIDLICFVLFFSGFTTVNKRGLLHINFLCFPPCSRYFSLILHLFGLVQNSFEGGETQEINMKSSEYLREIHQPSLSSSSWEICGSGSTSSPISC